MTTPHRDTEARVEGFEARLQEGFDWVNERGRAVAIGIGLLLLLGGIGAGVYEWRRSRHAELQAEYASIELRFSRAMGAEEGEAFVTEPANAEQAKTAREAALAELDQFATENSGAPLAAIASARAAELEIDLGRGDAADARLVALVKTLDSNEPLRGVALRLRGYGLDQRGDPLAAAEAYAEGARVEGYLARPLLWLEAGDAFERAGAFDRAVEAFREVLKIAPDVAEQRGLVARIGLLEHKSRERHAATPGAGSEF